MDRDSFDMNEEIEDEGGSCSMKESKKKEGVQNKPREKGKGNHNSEVCEINITRQNTTKSTNRNNRFVSESESGNESNKETETSSRVKVEHESEAYQRSPSFHCADFGTELRLKKRGSSRRIEQFVGFDGEFPPSPKKDSTNNSSDEEDDDVITTSKCLYKKQKKSAGTPIQLPLPASAIPSPIHPVVFPSASIAEESEGEEENSLNGGECVTYRGRRFRQYSVVLALENREEFHNSYHYVTIQDFRPNNKAKVHWEGYGKNDDEVISLANLIDVDDMVRFKNTTPKVGDAVYMRISNGENQPEGFWPAEVTEIQREKKRAKIKFFKKILSEPIELLFRKN